MRSSMPITDAVYPKRSTARRPRPAAKSRRRPATTLVRDRLRPEIVQQIERAFGLDKQRKRRGRR